MKVKIKIKKAGQTFMDQGLYDQVVFYLESMPDDTDFEDIRKDLNLSKAQLPDGYIHQIALDNGYEVG